MRTLIVAIPVYIPTIEKFLIHMTMLLQGRSWAPYHVCCLSLQMVVETEKCTMAMKMVSPEDVSDVLAHIGTCLRRIFPGLSPL